MNMKISVIIPNFNGSDLLRKSLPKILIATYATEIIVVDDASTDDSVEMVKTHFPCVKVIVRDKNEGFASTVNDGVKKASGDLILLLNSDVVPQENFMKYLTPHFDDSQVFAVGCLQRCLEDGKIIERGRGIGSFQKGFLMHSRGKIDKKNTLWVSAGAGIFRKNIWDRLGGMDKLYNPFYWEDIDLSYRALKAGFKLIFEPRSIVAHNQKEGAIKGNFTPQQVDVISYRNQILFVWLNITDFSLLAKHLLYLPIHLLRALVSFNSAFLKGSFLVIFQMPYVLAKRNKNKKLALTPDKEILAKVAN